MNKSLDEIDLDDHSRAVGDAWHPAAAEKFYRLWSMPKTRQIFMYNLRLRLALFNIVGKDDEATAEKLAKEVGLGGGTVINLFRREHLTYHCACYLCSQLGIGLMEMMSSKLKEEDLRLRIPRAI